jgi:D-alanyl-lipoteichoic acid acyltransferase DltB (MBOAT superfamily)
VLADVVLAPAADSVFAAHQVGFADAWIGTLAFAGQIFCDFAGYSLCAIGVARCLGFALPDNFRFPYAAVGLSEFWTRWHISLSTWLRDYLYIPLGGNRRGAVRTGINLMLTMLIGGLWHGAAWTFVVWGGLHGAYLIGERLLDRALPEGAWRARPVVQVAGALITFALVCVAWVWFRAASFAQAFAILAGMAGLGGGPHVLPQLSYRLVGFVMIAILATHGAMRGRALDSVVARAPWPVRSFALGTMILAILLMQGPDRAFLYFQF